eukprot:746679-Hanusia_phi.AAC.1
MFVFVFLNGVGSPSGKQKGEDGLAAVLVHPPPCPSEAGLLVRGGWINFWLVVRKICSAELLQGGGDGVQHAPVLENISLGERGGCLTTCEGRFQIGKSDQVKQRFMDLRVGY